ncbi:hypothetical protein IAI10_16505 [Clostridium sp. 19966]|uniref:hypothetical protein n=1 Tax=Clostridium sp. 19966 TaxID=2768166 RepID=UPI0028DDDB2F|nr:hypothetical protein [Clostridium sp. 19966]MDT8718270.1 hypothetical protein [Clostridium sp. 19966]
MENIQPVLQYGDEFLSVDKLETFCLKNGEMDFFHNTFRRYDNFAIFYFKFTGYTFFKSFDDVEEFIYNSLLHYNEMREELIIKGSKDNQVILILNNTSNRINNKIYVLSEGMCGDTSRLCYATFLY